MIRQAQHPSQGALTLTVESARTFISECLRESRPIERLDFLWDSSSPDNGSLAAFVGKSGGLCLAKVNLSQNGEEQTRFIVVGVTERGELIGSKLMGTLMALPMRAVYAHSGGLAGWPIPGHERLQQYIRHAQESLVRDLNAESGAKLRAEIEAVDQWSDAMRAEAQDQINIICQEIDALRRSNRRGPASDTRRFQESRIAELQRRRALKRRELIGIDALATEKREAIIRVMEQHQAARLGDFQTLITSQWQVTRTPPTTSFPQPVSRGSGVWVRP